MTTDVSAPEAGHLVERVGDLLTTETAKIAGTTFPVAIDYERSLNAMIKAGKYNLADEDITSKHFAMKHGPAEVALELVHFNRLMYDDEVLAELHEEGLRPATLSELLAFGAQYPNRQCGFPIVALGSVWRSRRRDRRVVPCLWGSRQGRCLCVCWLDFCWVEPFRFLAAPR